VLGIGQSGKSTENPQIPSSHEIQLNDYLISVTLLPGNPNPGQLTRIIVYTKNLTINEPFLGEMEFNVSEKIGFWSRAPFFKKIQHPIEDRHIQTIEFPQEGAYKITLGFTDLGVSHSTSLSLEVGTLANYWYYAGGLLVVFFVGSILWKARFNRKRLRPV